jgi:hypothetical protein
VRFSFACNLMMQIVLQNVRKHQTINSAKAFCLHPMNSKWVASKTLIQIFLPSNNLNFGNIFAKTISTKSLQLMQYALKHGKS